MLLIKEQILIHLRNAVISSDVEQGFILGSQTRLDQLDCCKEIPAVQASLNFYKPNSTVADATIQQWANNEVCFSGFLHSHVSDKNDLSEADIVFAERLYKAYCLPVLWFGLAIINECNVSFVFYAVHENNGTIQISPAPYQTI